ncbi:MAG: glucosaminidase domain-containing protein [Sulfuricella sp.]
MTSADFIAAIKSAAKESAHITGIPASFIIAQAALESGWGGSQLARVAYNLFGIKAGQGWKGNVITLPTRECIAGKWLTVNAEWRKYSGWLEAINDHAKFLILNPRYRLAMTGQRTGDDFARQVALAGYATDPNYFEKITAIIRQHHLDQYDRKD